MIELKSICFENIEVDEIGYWVKFKRSKQRSRLEESEVLIPRRQPYWIQCSVDSVRRPIDYDPASVIDAYLEAVMQDLKCTAEDLKGPFFKGTHGKNGRCFTRTNIGKNTLALVGIEAAKELGLRNPATFTGHCWRRSAGTNASDAGANVTSLMAMMGWSCPKTAMQYVKRSRITSLQMSLHLTNVQRRDVLDPFPSGSVRSRRTLKFREEAGSVEEVRTDVEGNRREESGSVEEVRMNVQGNRVIESSTVKSSSAGISSVASDVRIEGTVENVNDEDSDDMKKFEAAISVPKVGREEKKEEILHTFSVPVVYASELPGVCAGVGSGFVSNGESTSSEVFDLSSIDPRLVNVLCNLQNNGTVNINVNFQK